MPAPHRCVCFCILLLSAATAVAGPPFLTDDPEPVPYQHGEFYVFSTFDRSSGGTQLQAPAFELNYGLASNFQAHVVFPFTAAIPREGPRAYGAGDTEFGIKYRFLQESDDCPMAGVFPMLEIPTGDHDRGLGNGRTWVRLPLWLQKSWGPEGRQWTTYGGGGYACNPTPGQRNYPFAGWLLQKELGGVLTLGGELFVQGRSADNGQATWIANAGGSCRLVQGLDILFTLGHSLAGERHLIGYAGLYRTW